MPCIFHTSPGDPLRWGFNFLAPLQLKLRHLRFAPPQLRVHRRPRPLMRPSGDGIFAAFFALLPLLLGAQAAGEPLTGTAFDTDDYPLVGATVRWPDNTGTTVDAAGNFSLARHAEHDRFTVSFLGYETREYWLDTVDFPLAVVLYEAGTSLTEIQVTARDDGRSASILTTGNIESISSKELRKAPCCSLAESFENSPVVDLTYGDPLTGRREIQVLGLRGNYTQLTLEKKPMLDGLASPFALDLIPGPWVSGIQIGKGSGSLESGAQGMTGQINTELVKPTDGPKLFLNGFAGSQGRGELNVNANRRIGEKLWAGASLHGSFTGNDRDFDDDGFEDMPDRETAVGLFRLFRQGGDQWEGQWSLLVADDKRSGGQTERPNRYAIDQRNQRVEAWGKTGYFGFAKPWQSVGFIYSGSYHQLDNRYGNRTHAGEQRSGYLNALYHTRIGNDNHQVSLSGTARMDDFAVDYAGRDFGRMESTIGASGEYTFSWEEGRPGKSFKAFTALLGLRVDEHNLGGTQVSPRLNLKYNPGERTALRLSAGRGWRSPNVLVDNLNWLPSSREVIVEEREGNGDNPGFVGLESSWNYGVNLTRNFTLGGRDLQVIIDLFRTEFQDQLIVDAEQRFDELRIYQLDGESYANSFLASVNYEVLPLIDMKLAYKYNDVRQTYATNGLREVPLTPRHRALATLGYDGPRIKVHLNYHWAGEQRLLDQDILPTDVVVTPPRTTPSFGLLSTQVTYVMNERTQFYGGGENLTNVRQRNAIIGAENPFSAILFDATQVYQPIFGRRFYVGFRYTMD